MPLPAAEHKRLAAMLGIALSSAHEGEALAALKKALALCAKHKLTLFDALGSSGASALDAKRIAQVEEEAYKRGLATAIERAAAPSPRALEEAYNEGYMKGRTAAAAAMAARQAAFAAQTAFAAQAQVNVNAYGAGLGGLGNQAPNQGIYQPPPVQPPAPANDWRAAAKTLLKNHVAGLRPKDVDFLQSILARNRSRLTEAQNAWLADLASRRGVPMGNS